MSQQSSCPEFWSKVKQTHKPPAGRREDYVPGCAQGTPRHLIEIKRIINSYLLLSSLRQRPNLQVALVSTGRCQLQSPLNVVSHCCRLCQVYCTRYTKWSQARKPPSIARPIIQPLGTTYFIFLTARRVFRAEHSRMPTRHIAQQCANPHPILLSSTAAESYHGKQLCARKYYLVAPNWTPVHRPQATTFPCFGSNETSARTEKTTWEYKNVEDSNTLWYRFRDVVHSSIGSANRRPDLPNSQSTHNLRVMSVGMPFPTSSLSNVNSGSKMNK